MVKTPEGMSFRDFVKTIIPDADDKECEYILWERTPFPMVRDLEELRTHIMVYKEEKEKGKG